MWTSLRGRTICAALIAATALAHGLTVVTRNVADFEPSGVPLFNPWQPWKVHEASGRYAAAMPAAQANR